MTTHNINFSNDSLKQTISLCQEYITQNCDNIQLIQHFQEEITEVINAPNDNIKWNILAKTDIFKQTFGQLYIITNQYLTYLDEY